MAKIFLKVGGDEKWLAEGISNAPKYLREFSRLSCSMAYNFKQLQSSNLFSCIINGAKNLGKQYIF